MEMPKSEIVCQITENRKDFVILMILVLNLE